MHFWHYPLVRSKTATRWVHIVTGAILAIGTTLTVGAYLVLQSKIETYRSNFTLLAPPTADTVLETTPFPVSVDPVNEQFLTDPALQTYVQRYAASHISAREKSQWIDRLIATAATWRWYQQLATPSSRVLVVLEGQRKEEIANHIQQVLQWSKKERDTFMEEMRSLPPAFTEGTFFPGRYVVNQYATPEYVADQLTRRFNRTVSRRYPMTIETALPLQDTLTLASLLERETYKFTEMRIISGIIWNRIFSDMPLQIDATLQYAKASASEDTDTWWPVPRPDDKFIDSPFNTYKHSGLPPNPIANPGLASIIAALNPRPTDCFFYFHDQNKDFHCSVNYEQHVQKLRAHYGQGR
jgi:UPF0755 protein